MQPDLVCDLGYAGCNMTWSAYVRRGRPYNVVVVFVYVFYVVFVYDRSQTSLNDSRTRSVHDHDRQIMSGGQMQHDLICDLA